MPTPAANLLHAAHAALSMLELSGWVGHADLGKFFPAALH
jgi:hypothetical protein